MDRLRPTLETAAARRRVGFGMALLAVASLCGLASTAIADEREWTRWQKRHREAVRTVDYQRRHYASALAAYQKARHRRSVRGEEKQDILVKREEAREAWTQAERWLVEFRDEARREGVPPGYLRDAPTAPLPNS